MQVLLVEEDKVFNRQSYKEQTYKLWVKHRHKAFQTAAG
jgi:hypothetical protein